MKRLFSILLLILLMITATLSFVGNDNVAMAKSKRVLKLDYKVDTLCRYEKTCAWYALRNHHESAKYTYKSKNKKVATVSKKGVIYAKKPGWTKIIIRERYRGKTRRATLKIRVLRVKVRKFVFNVERIKDISEVDSPQEREDKNFGLIKYDFLKNYSSVAKYTYKSLNTKKLVISKYGQVIKALKFGKVKVAVYEEYKGKKKKIGHIYVNVVRPTLEGNGKTLTLYYSGHTSGEEYDNCDRRYPYNSYDPFAIVCKTKKEVDQIKSNTKLSLQQKYSNNNDNVLGIIFDDCVYAKAVGTRYVVVLDRFGNEAPTYVGYYKVVVKKGK